jgi:hypothetical protein
MRMNVGNVRVANEQQGWDVNLSQPRQCWLHWEFELDLVLTFGAMCSVSELPSVGRSSIASRCPGASYLHRWEARISLRGI